MWESSEGEAEGRRGAGARIGFSGVAWVAEELEVGRGGGGRMVSPAVEDARDIGSAAVLGGAGVAAEPEAGVVPLLISTSTVWSFPLSIPIFFTSASDPAPVTPCLSS